MCGGGAATPYSLQASRRTKALPPPPGAAAAPLSLAHYLLTALTLIFFYITVQPRIHSTPTLPLFPTCQSLNRNKLREPSRACVCLCYAGQDLKNLLSCELVESSPLQQSPSFASRWKAKRRPLHSLLKPGPWLSLSMWARKTLQLCRFHQAK